MIQLQRVSTAVPAHELSVHETREFVRRHLDVRRGARIMHMLDASRNHARHVVRPLRELEQLASVDERNEAYKEDAIALADAVARRALDGSGLERERIGTLVCVSATGFMVPALPAFLIDRLGLRPTCRGVALSQLGCAGGVAALGIGADLARQGGAEDAALVVSVEIPSLSLQIGEPSLMDIVAATQFGDGAAAALLTHAPSDAGLEIVATHRFHFAGTHAADGIRLTGCQRATLHSG
jgi:predicted naringenin-chalcone synthase